MMEQSDLRELAEVLVDTHWNETVNDDTKTFYGWFDYPKFSLSFIEKMKALVANGFLTQKEYDSLEMEDTRMAGGSADVASDTSIDTARLSVREDCIKFEMRRLQKLEET